MSGMYTYRSRTGNETYWNTDGEGSGYSAGGKIHNRTNIRSGLQGFSYAYRKGKSAKQASSEIYRYINYGYTKVVEIDIKGFFDHIDHEKMIFLVMKRIADPYVVKLIREWLRAGIVYGGETLYPSEETPQGGVISPLHANVYLNEIDTLWSKKVYVHDARMIRYADDITILTKNKETMDSILINGKLF